MPPVPKISKENIINASLMIVKEEGINCINARNIAKKLNCSTQPIFRVYKNMEELKGDLKTQIDNCYSEFINKYIDKKNYLFTVSCAYIEFARQEKNYFEALFFSYVVKSRTIEQVINSSWNRDTIIAETEQYSISLQQAEELYRDIRFFSHGIATQVCAGSITVESKEVEFLVDNAIKKFLK